MGGAGLLPNEREYDKTGVTRENIMKVLAKKLPHKKLPPFYTGGVQQTPILFPWILRKL